MAEGGKLPIKFGDVVDIGFENPEVQANPEANARYKAITESDTGSKRWYDFMEELADTDPKEVRQLCLDKMRAKYPKLDHSKTVLNRLGLGTPGILEKAHFSMEPLPAISGPRIKVPVLSFDRKTFGKLLSDTGQEGSQGVCFHLDIQPEMKPMGLVAYSRDAVAGFMPPDQIKLHEKIHSIDPDIRTRDSNDARLISELAAVIGEAAGGASDSRTVSTSPDFWRAVIREVPVFSDDAHTALGIPQTRAVLIPELTGILVEYTRYLTAGRSNTDVVLDLFSAHNFRDVLSMYPPRPVLQYT